MYFLETDRIALRRFNLSDSEFVLELWNDPDYITNVADRGIRTSADAVKYIAEKLLPNSNEKGFGPYLVESLETRTAIGFVGLFKRENIVDQDIGFAFLASFRGKGYALEAAKLLEYYGCTTLGLRKINGFTSVANQKSINVLLKLGMSYQKSFHMEGYEGDTRQYSKIYK